MSLSLHDTTEGGASKANSTTGPTKRDVEHAISLAEGDINTNETREILAPITPTKINSNSIMNKVASPQTPSGLQNQALAHTPRRSTRKSVKPVQEYEDIVSCKRRLRSGGKIENEHNEAEEGPQKWTPAKVGRVSQKRGRKSRRGEKNKKNLPNSSGNEESDVANDNQSGENPHGENESTQLNEPDIPIGNELTVMTPIKIETQNHEINLTKITFQFEDASGSESEAVNEIKPVANETDRTEHANIGTDLVQMGKSEISAASNAMLNNTIEVCAKEDESNRNDFGIYLNKYTIDLELNPLSEDLAGSLEDKAAAVEKHSHRSKDMSVVTIKNDTFNDSDCILLNIEQEAMEEDMQPLRISSDETSSSPQRKSPRIVLTTQEGEQHLLNSSLPLKDATPKRYSKTVLRNPTPFKAPSKNLSEDDELIAENLESDSDDAMTITVSKMELKDKVLRSIRKRSWSVCIGEAEAQSRSKSVKFYSPANETVFLEDLDVRIAQDVKKSSSAKKRYPETFVTQRRKRSLSFDEGSMMKKLKSPGQALTKMPTTPIAKPPRTRLPNFAAIHRKNFEKMENLVDHVSRKAERAKILTNSAAKIRNASAQKYVPPTNTTLVVEKPKAMRKIKLPNDLENKPFTEKTTKPSNTMATGVTHKEHSKLPMPQIAGLKPLPSPTESTCKENHTLNLPNPRTGIIRHHTITSFASSNNKNPTPSKVASIMPILKRQPLKTNLPTALASVNISNVKLSSSTVGVIANKVSTMSKTSVLSTTATTITSTTPQPVSFDQKMALRRQRRMDMFKGRGAANSQRTTPGTAEKNSSYQIRGVRSNRRFELQMAHRKNMEQ